MRQRFLALLIVALVLPTTGCAVGSDSSISARFGCFVFQATQAPPTNGAVLAVNVVATNVTNSPCSGPPCGGLTGGFVVTTEAGREVRREGPAGVMCRSDAPPPRRVRPGASVTWASFQWDGLGDLTGSRCVPGDCHLTRPRFKPGRYRVTWNWLDAVSVQSEWLHTTTS